MYFQKLRRGIPVSLKRSIVLLILIITFGTAGFHFLEQVDIITSLYWTIVTIATIGYGDVVPHTMVGKIFSIIIIISGVSVALLHLYRRNGIFYGRSAENHPGRE